MAKAKAAKSKASKVPGHYTDKGTRKFQANGDRDWAKVFMAAVKAAGGEREGEGIRLAMRYAVEHEKAFLAWAGGLAAAEAKAAKAAEAKASKAAK